MKGISEVEPEAARIAVTICLAPRTKLLGYLSAALRKTGESGRSRRLAQKCIEVEWAREHGNGAVRIAWPFVAGTIAIKLEAVLVGIAQIQRFAYSVVARIIE